MCLLNSKKNLQMEKIEVNNFQLKSNKCIQQHVVCLIGLPVIVYTGEL